MKKTIYSFIFLTLFLVSPVVHAETAVVTSEIDELRMEVKKMRVMLEDLALRIEKLSGKTKPLPVPEPIPVPRPIPCPIFKSDLSVGKTDSATSGEVTQLQNFLKETGDYTYPEVTGYFGPVTEKALRSWQNKNGIVSAGKLDEKTREIIMRPCGPVPVESFKASPLSGNAPLLVTFYASLDKYTRPSLYYVDFGDGSRSELNINAVECNNENGKDCPGQFMKMVSHKYLKSGSYTALLNKKIVCEKKGETTVCPAVESMVVGKVEIEVK